MALTTSSTLTLTSDAEHNCGGVKVEYDEEHKVIVMRQSADVIWVPYTDADAFLEAIKKWLEDMRG